MRQILLSALFALSPCVAGAIDWQSATPGHRITDGQLEVGRFVFILPSGEWHVTAKGTDRLSGFTGAAPPMLSIALGNIEDGKLLGTLSITTPANSFGSVNWGDAPCSGEKTVMAFNEGTSFRYPECLQIMKATPLATWSALDPRTYYARAVKKLELLNVPIPERAFEVFYLKTYRGDSLRMSVMIEGNPEAPLPSTLDAWGRALREASRSVVMNGGGAVVIPALPKP